MSTRRLPGAPLAAAALVALAGTGACSAAPPGSGAGRGGGLGSVSGAQGAPLRREDRVVVSTFNEVLGVAASRRLVFVLTPRGLAVFDRAFESWRPPLALGTDLPRARPTALAADPAADGVWIGGVGGVTYYQAATDFATRSAVAGVVDLIAFDARNPGEGAYVRASGRWARVSTTGFVTPLAPGQLPPGGALVVPATLSEIVQEYPALQSFASLLTRDAQLRSWPISAAAESPDRSSEVWVGTMGNGLYRVDPAFNRARHLPFGLLDPGASALALAADGVWIAGLGAVPGARGGLTFARDDLQEWRWIEGSPAVSLAGARVHDLDVRGSDAWLATDRGLVRANTRAKGAGAGAPGDAGDFVVWSATNGLPADRALAVVARDDGAWVGTAAGLAFVSDGAGGHRRSAAASSVGPVVASGSAVRALLLTGDTVWAGTDVGLLVVPPGEPRRAARPPAQAADARLGREVTALATADTEVVAAGRGFLLRLDRRSGRLLGAVDAAALTALGGVRALAIDRASVWAAGPNGVAIVDRAGGGARLLGVPADLPAEAFDVALGGDYAWVATRDGVVRLRRLRNGGVP